MKGMFGKCEAARRIMGGLQGRVIYDCVIYFKEIVGQGLLRAKSGRCIYMRTQKTTTEVVAIPLSASLQVTMRNPN